MYLQQTEEQQAFRESLRGFINKHILPRIDHWEEKGEIDRDIWTKMGEMGYLGLIFPERYGGMELDFFYVLIFCEELSRCFSGGFTISVLVSQFMSSPYLLKYGSEALKNEFLTAVIRGEMISAIAITEPGAGSDVKNISTTAVRKGDHYLVNGSKTFITNGYTGDFLITAVKTDPTLGTKGISLLLIESNRPGVTAHKIKKMGWHASDTAEISFDQVEVPVSHLIGQEGHGFQYLMDGLQLERLIAAIHSLYTAQSAWDYTHDYVRQREAFSKYLKDFQVIRHRLAQMYADLTTQEAFIYHCCRLQEAGAYAVQECSIAKLQNSELAVRVVNECLQMFGGYGFTEDYKIARLYRDVRVGTIIAGTSEIMLEILAKTCIDDIQYSRKPDQTN